MFPLSLEDSLHMICGSGKTRREKTKVRCVAVCMCRSRRMEDGLISAFDCPKICLGLIFSRASWIAASSRALRHHLTCAAILRHELDPGRIVGAPSGPAPSFPSPLSSYFTLPLPKLCLCHDGGRTYEARTRHTVAEIYGGLVRRSVLRVVVYGSPPSG